MRRLALSARDRCNGCRLPPRWCVCAAADLIRVPLAVEVLIHQREHHRPSSTGNLVARVIAGARPHAWGFTTTSAPADLLIAGRETWILHPHGEPPPPGAAPDRVQALLLDGAWAEAAVMQRVLAPTGRLVALRMTGKSRYWLRAQQDGGRFSTAEALIELLGFFGLEEAAARLRAQLELHVYAHLRARGRAELAAEFLAGSPIREAFPDLIAQLNTRRPR
ncbi:MAG: DTW domain-containing protein [Opitutaceae bacterium]|nr:DTW domain-containing protein [Opitutaceae bacterium]